MILVDFFGMLVFIEMVTYVLADNLNTQNFDVISKLDPVAVKSWHILFSFLS